MKRIVLIVLWAGCPWYGLRADELLSSPAPKTGYVVVQSGRTKKPVILEYEPGLTVMSTLGSAEITAVSPVKHVWLIRDGKVTVIDSKRLRGHPEEDLKLVPGDVVQIPDTMF